MQKSLKTHAGRTVHIPTKEEDARINAGIASDEDTHELGATEFKHLRRGRPVAVTTKERITIRLSPEVVEHFRESGAGWQTRMDKALQEWIEDHKEAA